MMHAENFITEASTGQDTRRGAGEIIILLADISAMGVGGGGHSYATKK